jgi:3-oxoacyl-[acyl-carrier-protein] synthase III
VSQNSAVAPDIAAAQIGIAGIGVALAENRVDPWDEIAPAAGMKESLRDYLGCYSVPIANEQESPSHFAVIAARQALDEAGVRPQDVDLVISNNITSDYLDWQMSGHIAQQLGITGVTTFDIYAGCNSTGIAYQTAAAIMTADPGIETVLIALAEHLGGGTFPQFIGDGGCAWVLRRGHSELNLLDFSNINAEMPRLGLLPEGGVVRPFTAESKFDGEWQDNVEFNMDAYKQELKPIFVPMCASPLFEVCEKVGITPNDLDRVFLVHQQKEFNRKLINHLGVDEEKTPLHYIHDLGHISGFDIFICLKRAIAEGYVKPGNLIGLVVMGLGELHAFLVRY